MRAAACGWPVADRSRRAPTAPVPPLRDAPVGLTVEDERVDRAADVVHRRVAHDRDIAGLGIDLDLADRAAEGKPALRIISSPSAGQRPPQSSARSLRSRAAFATSNRPIERSVPFTANRPRESSTSATAASSRTASTSTSRANVRPSSSRSDDVFAGVLARGGVAEQVERPRVAAGAARLRGRARPRAGARGRDHGEQADEIAAVCDADRYDVAAIGAGRGGDRQPGGRRRQGAEGA